MGNVVKSSGTFKEMQFESETEIDLCSQSQINEPILKVRQNARVIIRSTYLVNQVKI